MQGDELVGTTLDRRYRITGVLGRGGMGSVYVADHLGLARRVAIKFLHPDAAADADARVRFQREARAAGKVVHEHVVHVFDVGTSGGRDYIAMELVDGIDLERVLASGALSVSRAIAITRQLLAGVGAIHAAGFVHRDIKPANIVLAPRDDGSDFVKIMDFGVAKTLKSGDDTVTSTGKVVGTLAYMAPEQLTGGTVDHRADLYAVGLTFHMMLTGGLPSTAFTRVAEAQRDERPTSLAGRIDGLPPAAAAALENALEANPARRFASARDFLSALDGGPIRSRDNIATAIARRGGPAHADMNAPTGVADALGATGVSSALGATGVSSASAATVAPPARASAARARAAESASTPGVAAAPSRSNIGIIALAIGVVAAAGVTGYLLTRKTQPAAATSARTDAAASPSTAAAAAAADAGIDHIARGREAELAGKLQVAIAEYEEAVANKGPAELLYRLGELSDRLGRRQEAVGYFERYLVARPDAPDRELVASRIAAGGTVAARAPAVHPPQTSSTAHRPVKADAPSHPRHDGTSDSRCDCINRELGVNLCAARSARPSCTCQHTQYWQMLCRYPLHGDGQRDCVDITRPECLTRTPPKDCTAWLTNPTAKDGDACRGFMDQTEIDGAYDCTYCETIWFGVAGRAREQNTKSCRGYHPKTAMLENGKLANCR